MDCCRSSKRLGGSDVKVIVRSPFEEMKASPWEKEDAVHEDIPIINMRVPKEFTHKDGKLTGVTFEVVEAQYDDRGRRRLVPTGEPDQHFECDDVLVAIGHGGKPSEPGSRGSECLRGSRLPSPTATPSSPRTANGR